MSAIFAIDPGPTKSGWVLLADGRVSDSGVSDNHDLLRWVQAGQGADTLAVEMIAAYGMPVGREVFETVLWVGRFTQAWSDPGAVRLIYRRDVKLHLCGTARAKDGNVRQALIDAVGPQGTKKAPGPCYGIKTHAWAALGVAVTALAAVREVTT